MLERVFAAIADVMGVPRESLNSDSNADTVPNWDSLHVITLALALEANFDVSFTPEEIAQMLSVRAVMGILKDKAAA
jgi:acyl carrier protein